MRSIFTASLKQRLATLLSEGKSREEAREELGLHWMDVEELLDEIADDFRSINYMTQLTGAKGHDW